MSDPEQMPRRAGRSRAGPHDQLPEHYVESDDSLVERPTQVLKYGDLFAVLDCHGDIASGSAPWSASSEGMFYRDTRHLSHLQLCLDERPLLLLSSVIQEDNAALSIDLTNADIHANGNRDGPILVERDTIHVWRTKFLWQGACYERILLRNFGQRRQSFAVSFSFDADFRDLFEVRGETRSRRGWRSVHLTQPDRVEFRYRGLDEIVRRTVLAFDPAPARLGERLANYGIDLAPNARTCLFLRVSCHGR